MLAAAAVSKRRHAADVVPVSQGIRGVTPEPTGGFQIIRARDRALESFCAAVWFRHEVHRRPNPRMWPTSGAFKANMPGIAFDLVVAAWKIDEAAEDIPRERPPEGSEREHWLYGTSTPDVEPNGNLWQRHRHEAMPTSELVDELLDPPVVPERDAREIFAAELANNIRSPSRGISVGGLRQWARSCATVSTASRI